MINKIYNMDFVEGLKMLKDNNVKIDMVITDPPYNIRFDYDVYEDNLSDEDYIKLISHLRNMPLAIIQYPELTMKYFVPALGVPDRVMAWCYNSRLPRQYRLISVFDKKVDFSKVKQPYKNVKDKRVQQQIEKGSEGANIYDWFSDIQQFKASPTEEEGHPCPVPVALFERIILLTTKEGDTVLDPFMGGGTLAIACLNTKRNYIGFEISPSYVEMAEKRIKKWNEENDGKIRLEKL